MPIKLMYITNDPVIASIAENAGVDRIFIDMEVIGKSDRQSGMNTVQSNHTIDDIRLIKSVSKRSEIIVRCNSIKNCEAVNGNFVWEIERILACEPDIIMLPYFTTADEVRRFIDAVNGRARTMILIETPQAAENLDEILKVEGIDEAYIGLNDLSLGYGMKFMFEPLGTEIVDNMAKKIRDAGIPFGFGGIASIGKGKLPAECLIREHYRLGSTIAILSRSFYNTEENLPYDEVNQIFDEGIRQIRAFEKRCAEEPEINEENHAHVVDAIRHIVQELDAR